MLLDERARDGEERLENGEVDAMTFCTNLLAHYGVPTSNQSAKEEKKMPDADYVKKLLAQVAKALAAQFGSDCEVAVHDLTKGYEQTIIAIENGHVTKRKVGDDASEIVLSALKDKAGVQDALSYLTRTPDGRLLKSSSIYVKDPQGEVIALLGINYDITQFSHTFSVLGQFITAEQDKKDREVSTITPNVNDLLDQLLEESWEYVGKKPVALMSKEDKVRAVHYLDQKGAFLVKKAGDRVTKYYDISKYTLYNYLDSEPTGK
ncbi:MAG: helix-turn-helix transcriptional regulator [Oscillospiraceae bacterium]|nr:helix-turn-helix transcriptional regulator [Oscillospiraceae bacterium]